MNPQVLCIEDDPDIALAVRLVLRRAGLTVVHAANGRGRAADVPGRAP